MRTSEVARRAGVNVQTLRYYERRGLVAQPPRSSSGYRAYPSTAVRTIRFIKRAQSLGFTLDEIEELLELAVGGPEGCDTVREMAGDRIVDLDRRIAALTGMRAALARLVDTCEMPLERRECPILHEIDLAQPGEAHVGSELD
ncbi:DNA-binding transcriptional regulator, MerR family [Amycolatopsis tolypomycina]|uniref:DNA-binding transcriptional regulator, MerR family n=1 Tax=Amycolatopsis tolypomycina TaxID=208445 RepID=A0A1H4JL40_9PSEU|nr:MerR family transcriptional regulator [Amycolatopsis tolypomycina]SEB46983.1 DNA-binding transcriptional regulator, MerR family [Amycolatopsis tolypomycina]